MGRDAAGNAIFAALHRRVASRAAGEAFGRRFLQPCAKRQNFALAVQQVGDTETLPHVHFFKTMATGARLRHRRSFLRGQRTSTHSIDADADEATPQGSWRLPEPAPASWDSSEAQWAISETPNQDRQATAAHACPGAVYGCPATPRGRGRVHSRWQAG